MNETRYLISEAAKVTQVEAHVLRYWEEELGLAINRNEMGHRYYTEKDIRIFQNIKELKKKGLQLRAIRRIIHEEDEIPVSKRQEAAAGVIGAAKESKEAECSSDEVIVKSRGERIPDVQKSVKAKTREQRFGEIMERIIYNVEKGEPKESRYRRLDEAIRQHQQSRKLVAATEENAKRKHKRKNRRADRKKTETDKEQIGKDEKQIRNG